MAEEAKRGIESGSSFICSSGARICVCVWCVREKIHSRQDDQCPETTLRPSGKQDRCREILIVLLTYIRSQQVVIKMLKLYSDILS